MAFTPVHERAEWARSPRVVTSTRSVPWQPASTTPSDGSIKIAKSACSSSGWLFESSSRPLRSASTSSHS